MSVISLVGLLSVVMVAVVGCEVRSSTEPITISPSTARLLKGESVQFTAEGGYDYTWSLGGSGTTASAMGYLSSSRGPTVTYTSTFDTGGSNDVSETLTVVSTIVGDAAGTNSESSLSGGSGTATIIHYGHFAEGDTLTINPSSVTIRNGQTITFTASGGNSYIWSLSTDSATPLGTLSARSGNAVSYTSFFDPGVGTNVQVLLTVKSTPPGAAAASSYSAYITHVN